MASRALRVMHLTAASDAGGVSRYLLELNRALSSRGVQVSVAGGRGPWHDRFEAEAIPWIEAPLNGSYFSLRSAARALAQRVLDDPPDILHAHYRKAAIVGRYLQQHLARACTSTRARAGAGHRPALLFTLHLTGIPMGFPWRWLSDFGDHAHAPSLQARDWLTRVARVPESRISVIPHGIDAARFPEVTSAARLSARQQLNLPPEATIAAYVGRLEDPKNEAWILDLAARLPEVYFVFAGEGPNRAALEAQRSALNLASRVRFLGTCDPLPVYHAADALLLPSAREGFSYVCAEAMACGIPVLRTRTAGTEELILEDQTGRSCDIRHDAFLAAARSFLQSRATLAALGQNAARHVREHLRFDQQVEATLALYQRLAAPA